MLRILGKFATARGLAAAASLTALAAVDGRMHAAAAQNAPAPATAQPLVSYPQALILVRSSLSAVEQANETGNYAVLYALGSKGFQTANPPQKLADTFAALRIYNLNSILVLEPQFTQTPALTRSGMMTMAGFFASDGYRVNFQLLYTPEGGHWKLFGISTGVEPAPQRGVAASSR